MKHSFCLSVLLLIPFMVFPLEFDFYNNTDFDILHVYARPDSGDILSADLVEQNGIIAPLESVHLIIDIPDDNEYKWWTLVCIDADGTELIISGIPLTSCGSVSLEWSRFRGAVWETE